MKIQHIFDAEDELEFFFAWKSPRREDEQSDCGKEDGRWQKGTQLKAA